MSRLEAARKAINSFASNMTAKGFKVYIVNSNHYCYGWITDNSTSRVTYFQYCSFDGLQFTGCYRASRQSGTGWQIMETHNLNILRSDMLNLINTNAPQWANTNPSYSTICEVIKDKDCTLFELEKTQQPSPQFNDCK